MKTIKAKKVVAVCTTVSNGEALAMMLLSVLGQDLMPEEIFIYCAGEPLGTDSFYLKQCMALARIKQVRIVIEAGPNNGVRKNRDHLLEYARRNGFDYAWMVDDDVFFESDYLWQLCRLKDALRKELKSEPDKVAWYTGFKADVSNTRGYKDFQLDIKDKLDGSYNGVSVNHIYDVSLTGQQDFLMYCPEVRTLDTGCALLSLMHCEDSKFTLRDDHLNAGGEDTAFALQLCNAGYSGKFNPCAASWHLEKPNPRFDEFAARGEMLLSLCEQYGWDKAPLEEFMPWLGVAKNTK